MSIIDKMAYDLLLDRAAVEEIASATNNYRRIRLNSGRVVWQPTSKLKLLQYWIVDYVMHEGAFPQLSATAYEPHCSIVVNARHHKDCRHLLHIDIKEFFSSVSKELLRAYFRKPPLNNLSHEDVELILNIVTFRGGLVMGAPSSPMLANRAMIDIDDEIAQLVSHHSAGATYTRYSDDIAVSSMKRIDESLFYEIAAVLDKNGFEVNRLKTKWLGPGSNRKIAGIAYTNEGKLSLGQKRKKELKKRLYEFALDEKADRKTAERLLGYINFARSVEPEYVSRQLVKYSAYGSLPTMRKIKLLLSNG